MSNPEIRRLALELAVKARADLPDTYIVETAEKFLAFLDPPVKPPLMRIGADGSITTVPEGETLRTGPAPADPSRWFKPSTREKYAAKTAGAGWGPETGADNLADLRAGEPLADVAAEPTPTQWQVTQAQVEAERRESLIKDLHYASKVGGLKLLTAADAHLILKMLGEAAD